MTITAQIFIFGMCLSFTLSFIDHMVPKWWFSWGLTLSWALYNSGLFALWLFLLLQIYYAFKDTQYLLRRSTIMAHIVMMNLSEMLFITAMFLHELEVYPAKYFVAIPTVLFIAGSLGHLAWLLHRKLFNLIV